MDTIKKLQLAAKIVTILRMQEGEIALKIVDALEDFKEIEDTATYEPSDTDLADMSPVEVQDAEDAKREAEEFFDMDKMHIVSLLRFFADHPVVK